MSPSSSLSRATRKLTLDDSLDFSSTFTLISADSHYFSVDALKLAGHSSVFADMLKSASGERECTLTEGREQVERFLAVVETGMAPTDEEQWFDLLEMTDKYDSPCAKLALKDAAWRFSNTLAQYSAGCLLNDQPLLEAGEQRWGIKREQEESFLHAVLTKGHVDRLSLYYQHLKEKQVGVLTGAALMHCTHCTCPSDRSTTRYEHYWLSLVKTAISKVSCWTNPSTLLQDAHMVARTHTRPECSRCMDRILESISQVAAKWNGKDGRSSVKL